jgi:hypothetical protein
VQVDAKEPLASYAKPSSTVGVAPRVCLPGAVESLVRAIERPDRSTSSVHEQVSCPALALSLPR